MALNSPPLGTVLVNPSTGQNNPAWLGWFTFIYTRIAALRTQADKTVYGLGSPEGQITAEPGTIFINEAGGTTFTFWVKESGTGNLGWKAK